MLITASHVMPLRENCALEGSPKSSMKTGRSDSINIQQAKAQTQ